MGFEFKSVSIPFQVFKASLLGSALAAGKFLKLRFAIRAVLQGAVAAEVITQEDFGLIDSVLPQSGGA